jgi:hypothetical protein
LFDSELPSELDGPVRERCGPGDCGLVVEALLIGEYWSPGRWKVIPPAVAGWKEPSPPVIVVEAGELTTFDAEYEPA